MNEVFLTLMEYLNINILVFAAIGAIFGESKRELSDDIDVEIKSFVKEILMSFTAAVVLGVVAFEITEKVIASSCASAFAGYNGYSYTIKLLTGILEKFSSKD